MAERTGTDRTCGQKIVLQERERNNTCVYAPWRAGREAPAGTFVQVQATWGWTQRRATPGMEAVARGDGEAPGLEPVGHGFIRLGGVACAAAPRSGVPALANPAPRAVCMREVALRTGHAAWARPLTALVLLFAIIPN